MDQLRALRRLPVVGRRGSIGLEISAGHIRVASGNGSVPLFGECAPPSSVLEEGRIVDPEGIAEAIRELLRETGIHGRDVVVGVSNHDVVARQVEMPMLEDHDLASALRFELADMIPFPVADALIRFRRIDDLSPDRATPQLRVLAVAALTDTLRTHVDVAERAGLRVRSIDLSTFALTRAAAAATPLTAAAEAVVSVASDGLSVVIHRGGVVRFSRSITTRLGSSIAGELESELALIERYRSGAQGSVATATRADPIVEAIKGTLEYASIQPGAATIERVVICGDGLAAHTALLLGDELSVPVITLDPAPDQLGRGDDGRFAVALGLTLPGDDAAAGPRPLDLLPDRRSLVGGRALARRGALAAVGAALILGAGTVAAGPDLATASDATRSSERELAALNAQLSEYRSDAAAATELARRDGRLERIDALSTDWARFVTEIRSVAPPGGKLATIAGTAAAVSKSGRITPGSIKITGTAPSQGAVSDWMDAIGAIPGLGTPWISSVSGTAGHSGNSSTSFTITVQIERPRR